MKRQLGMTLLEMLVALAIFAIIGGALYPVITGALASRQSATARVALHAEARMILERLEQDIVANCESGFPGPLPPRFVAAAPTRDLASEHVILEATTLVARGVTAADAFVGGEDIAALSVDRGDQAQVIWRVDSSGKLLRQELRPPRTEMVDWTRQSAQTLSEHATLALEFYEPENWLEAWDSREAGPHRGRAPVAVRSILSVGNGESAVRLVSTVVLPVVASLKGNSRDAGGNP